MKGKKTNDVFFVVRTGADIFASSNTNCEEHGGNCCQSGFCCNHGSAGQNTKNT